MMRAVSLPLPGWLRSVLDFIGEMSLLLWRSGGSMARRAIEWPLVLDQVVFIGVDSISLVGATATLSGMVLAVYTVDQFRRFGGTEFVGGLISVSMAQEVAPVLTAIVVAARAGSAIAAEIGTMKVTEQVDALRTMATDPVEYLVVPRVLAGMMSLPILTMLATLLGTLGGYAVAEAGGISPPVYWNSVRRFTKVNYLSDGWIKAIVFGLLITLVGCQQGFRAERSAAEVGQVTTNAVVLCVFLVYLADYFLALVLV